jgi:hypothetical protein
VLLVFIGILFLRPLGLLLDFGLLDDLAGRVPSDLQFMIVLEMFAKVVLAVWGSVVALQLFKKKPQCLAKLRLLLKISFWYLAIDLFIAIALFQAEIEVTSVVRSLVFLVPCYFYFKMSKTVRAIYGANL